MSIQLLSALPQLSFFCRLTVNFNLILTYSVYKLCINIGSQEPLGALHCESMPFTKVYDFTESLRLEEITKSSPLLTAQSTRAGRCSVGFWVSPQLETPHLWVTHAVPHHHPRKKFVLMFKQNFLHIDCCLLSFHWTLPRRICLCLLYRSGICTQW